MADNPVKGTDLLDIKSIEKVTNETISLLESVKKKLQETGQVRLENIEKITAAQADSVKALDQEEKQINQITEQVKRNNKQLDRNKKLREQVSNLNQDEVKERIKLQKVLKDSRDAARDELILQDKTVGTLEKINAENRVLRRERAALNLETKEGAARLKEINELLDQNNSFVKENSDQLKQQKLNVGNYTESITEALGETDLFGFSLNQVSAGFARLRQGIGKTIKSLRTLKGALAATGITLLLAALVSLGQFFTKNIEGARAFEKILATLTATIDVVVGRLIRAGKALFAVGEALIDLNFSKARQEFASLSTVFDGVGDAIEKQVEGALKLVEAQQRLRDTTRELRIEIAQQAKIEEEQAQIAGDSTRSFAELEKAAERARVAGLRRAEAQRTLAQEELNLVNQRVEQAEKVSQVNEDLLDEQVTAQEALIEAEKELLLVERQNEQERRQIRQDRLERDLDFLLDIFDNQKTINERIIADESITFARRRDLLEETRKLGNAAFEDQVKIFEEFAEQRINFNELIAESDARVVRDRVRQLGVSEIIEGRIIEVIRDRKTEISDLAEAERDLAESRRKQIEANLQNEIKAVKAATSTRLKLREIQLRREQKTEEEISTDLRETRIFELTLQVKQLKKLGEETIDQELEIARLRAQIDKDANDKILAQREALNRKIQDESVSLLNSLSDFSLSRAERDSEIRTQQREQELEEQNELLENQVKAGLITEENANKIRESREKEFEEEQKKIQRRQAVRERQAEIFKATVAGIRAVIQAGGLTPLGIATAAFNAVQVALLAATPLPVFKEGGIFDPETGLIGGNRHDQGGTKFYDQYGRPQFEAEKGELLNIISREDVPFYNWLKNRDALSITKAQSELDLPVDGIVTELRRDKSMGLKNRTIYALSELTGRATAKHMRLNNYYEHRYR